MISLVNAGLGVLEGTANLVEHLAAGDFIGDRRQDLAIGDRRAGREEGVDDMLGDPLYCPGFHVLLGCGRRTAGNVRRSLGLER